MATAGNDALTGTSGADFMEGLEGADSITGLGGNDTLSGGPGNDRLSGGPQASGSDVLLGGSGADLFFPSPSEATLDGGDGLDRVWYLSATGGVTVDLAMTGPQTIGGGMGVETLLSIEQVVATPFNDILFGNGPGTSLFPLGGDDYVDARGGAVVYSTALSGITADLKVSGPQSIGGGQGVDTLLNVGRLVGGLSGDHLTGNDGDNVLFGISGNDTLQGSAGDDLLIGDGLPGGPIAGRAEDDYLDGGAGYDVARFTGALTDYQFDFQAGGTLVVTDLRPGSPEGTDTLVDIEALEFAPIVVNESGLNPAPDIPVGILRAYSRLLELGADAPGAAQDALSDAADRFIARSAGLFSADTFAV